MIGERREERGGGEEERRCEGKERGVGASYTSLRSRIKVPQV